MYILAKQGKLATNYCFAGTFFRAVVLFGTSDRVSFSIYHNRCCTYAWQMVINFSEDKGFLVFQRALECQTTVLNGLTLEVHLAQNAVINPLMSNITL